MSEFVTLEDAAEISGIEEDAILAAASDGEISLAIYGHGLIAAPCAMLANGKPDVEADRQRRLQEEWLFLERGRVTRLLQMEDDGEDETALFRSTPNGPPDIWILSRPKPKISRKRIRISRSDLHKIWRPGPTVAARPLTEKQLTAYGLVSDLLAADGTLHVKDAAHRLEGDRHLPSLSAQTIERYYRYVKKVRGIG